MFKFFKVCSFTHSRLGRGFFSTNSSISEVWLGSDQPVALLIITASAHLYFWIDCLLYFYWKHLIDSYGVQVRHVGWPIKHSDIMVSKPLGNGFVLWAGAKVLLEKENSISIKLFSRWKHKVLQNLLVDGCFDFGLDKTQWANTSRRHGSPNHHRLRKLHTGLQAACILCLSTLPPDSGTLISKQNAKFTFIWKEDFGPLSNSPVPFLLSPGKILLKMFLSMVTHDALTPASVHSLWSSPKCFAWQYFQACGHLCCLYTFSYPISSFQLTLHLICFETALLEQPPLLVMTLCDLPSLWRVSIIVFWTIAKSAVFPIIVVSKNKRFILYGWSFIETQI